MVRSLNKSSNRSFTTRAPDLSKLHTGDINIPIERDYRAEADLLRQKLADLEDEHNNTVKILYEEMGMSQDLQQEVNILRRIHSTDEIKKKDQTSAIEQDHLHQIIENMIVKSMESITISIDQPEMKESIPQPKIPIKKSSMKLPVSAKIAPQKKVIVHDTVPEKIKIPNMTEEDLKISRRMKESRKARMIGLKDPE